MYIGEFHLSEEGFHCSFAQNKRYLKKKKTLLVALTERSFFRKLVFPFAVCAM